MRRNVSGLLSQFGFSVNNDLLAALIVAFCFGICLAALALAGLL